MRSNNDTKKSLKWHNKVEKIIYECLGIKLFRKLVFKLERIIHRKDKGRNINYHLARNGFSDITYFTRYLFYNGAIHVRNIGYALTYVLIRLLVDKSFYILDAVVIIFSIKDIYCIMLQRYNYLRITERINILKEKRRRTINHQVQSARSSSLYAAFCDDDIQWINSLRSQLQSKSEYIYISDDDVERLTRFSRIIKCEKKELNSNGLQS